MKNRKVMFSLMSLALVFSILASLSLISNGCGTNPTGGGGGGGAAAPVIHTIYLATGEVPATMLGLAVDSGPSNDVIFVAFALASGTRELVLFGCSQEGAPLIMVTKEAANLAGTACIRTVFAQDSGILYIGYREWTSGPGHHIGVATMEIPAGIGGPLHHHKALSGASITTGNIDLGSVDTLAMMVYTDSSPAKARGIDVVADSGGDIQALNSVENDGGIAGDLTSPNTFEAVYVNAFTGPATSEIIFAKTSDSGTNWSTTVLTSSATLYARNVDITAWENNTIVSYFRSNKLYTRFSSTEGATWYPELEISDCYDDMTSIALSTDKANIVFTGNNGKDICLARSGQDMNWSVTTLVSLADSGRKYPEIQADGDMIVIIYRTSDGVYMLRSYNNGASWI